MRPSSHDLRKRQSRSEIDFRGLVRRVLVRATKATGIWQLLGFKDGEGNEEIFPDVEVFDGIGIRARPRAGGGKAEVVVIHIGGESAHPIVVASRDASISVDVGDDETVIFNSTGTLVKITAGGKVELGAAGLAAIDGVVTGRGIDPWTGMTYFELQNASSVVRAVKDGSGGGGGGDVGP